MNNKLFKYVNLISFVLFALSLISGNFLNAALFFTLSAVTSSRYKLGVLSACVIDCEVADIETSDDCNIRGGLKTIYWAQYADIDWDAMEIDPLQFDQTTQEILDYTMVGGAVFYKMTFDRKLASYNFTYTEDADVYEQVVTTIFEGKSTEIRNAFTGAIGCCKIILHIFDNNCLERVVGVEWDGTSFEPQVKTLRFVRHLDSSGEFGSTKARDELDIGGESLVPPLFAQVTEASMPV